MGTYGGSGMGSDTNAAQRLDGQCRTWPPLVVAEWVLEYSYSKPRHAQGSMHLQNKRTQFKSQPFSNALLSSD